MRRKKKRKHQIKRKKKYLIVPNTGKIFLQRAIGKKQRGKSSSNTTNSVLTRLKMHSSDKKTTIDLAHSTYSKKELKRSIQRLRGVQISPPFGSYGNDRLSKIQRSKRITDG